MKKSDLIVCQTLIRAFKNHDKKDMETRKYFVMPTKEGEQPTEFATYLYYASVAKENGYTHLRLVDIDGLYVVDVNKRGVHDMTEYARNN